MSPSGFSPFIVLMIALPMVIAAFVVFRIRKAIKPYMESRKLAARLLSTGSRAKARVLRVRETGTSVQTGGHRQLMVRLDVEVHVVGQRPVSAKLAPLVSEVHIPQVQPGAWLDVRYDPMDPTKVALEALGATPPGQPEADSASFGFPDAREPSPFGMPSSPDPVPFYPDPVAPRGGPIPVHPPQQPRNARVVLLAAVAIAVLGMGGALFFVGAEMNSDSEDRTSAQDGVASPVCARAVACCLTVAARAEGPTSPCNELAGPGGTDAVCRAALQGFEAAAKALKLSCD